MEKSRLINAIGTGLLAGSILANAGCQTKYPPIVQAFSGIYEGEQDDAFQRRIYLSAVRGGRLDNETIEDVRNFFECSKDEASSYSDAQGEFYREFSNMRRMEDDGLGSFYTLSRLMLNNGSVYVTASSLLDNLKKTHKTLDDNKELDTVYTEIGKSFINH